MITVGHLRRHVRLVAHSVVVWLRAALVSKQLRPLNPALMIMVIGCAIILFRALAGVGYVEYPPDDPRSLPPYKHLPPIMGWEQLTKGGMYLVKMEQEWVRTHMAHGAALDPIHEDQVAKQSKVDEPTGAANQKPTKRKGGGRTRYLNRLDNPSTASTDTIDDLS